MKQQKTWIDLLGKHTENAAVDANRIARFGAGGAIQILWSFDSHAHAKDVFAAWKAESQAAEQTAHDALLLEIAKKHFFVDTLEERKSDRLDFHDVSVVSMKAALEEAFQAGRQHA